jgi:hypothetical protein
MLFSWSVFGFFKAGIGLALCPRWSNKDQMYPLEEIGPPGRIDAAMKDRDPCMVGSEGGEPEASHCPESPCLGTGRATQVQPDQVPELRWSCSQGRLAWQGTVERPCHSLAARWSWPARQAGRTVRKDRGTIPRGYQGREHAYPARQHGRHHKGTASAQDLLPILSPQQCGAGHTVSKPLNCLPEEVQK